MGLRSVSDIGKAIGQRFGPLLNLFGSATAVSALLLAAGFLSDFGAYHVASLPRLHFSLTALAEAGAEVLIDAAALVIASPSRSILMFIMLVALLLVWALRERHPGLRHLARSVSAYRAVRLAVFMFAAFLMGSTVDRVQTSLSGDDRSAAAVDNALRGAYASHFPDPWEREFALEYKTYEMRFFPFPNLGARLDRAWGEVWNSVGERTGLYWLKSGDGEETVSGIPLRRLPEARDEARQVFGWVALAVVILVTLNALLRWWGSAVGDTTRAERDEAQTEVAQGVSQGDTNPPTGSDEVDSSQRWVRFLGIDGWASPIERILAPLTVFMTVVTIMLLPLLHGVLARTSLGGETVMAFLVDKGDAKAGEGATAKASKAVTIASTGGCSTEVLQEIKKKETELDEALRAALQAHPAHEEADSKAARKAYKDKAISLADAVLAAECPDAVALMWSARPSMGTAAHEPNLAEFFWSELKRVSDARNVQVGVILGYPREGQALSLVDSIVPSREAVAGQWSVLELPTDRISHTVVLPNILGRRLAEIDAQVRADSTHDSIQDILVKPGEQSFEVVLKLLKDGALHANPAGVGVTTLGSMAYVASRDRPRLTAEAVDLLVDFAKASPTAIWPRKSASSRGAAVTSLMLSRSPYAAYRLAEALEEEATIKDCKPNANGQIPLRCIRQTPTAAGFLMDTLALEGRYQRGLPSPLLRQTQGRLLNYLIDVTSTGSDISDGVRNAACTAIQLAGKLPQVPDDVKARFWKIMSTRPFAQVPYSSGACILAMWPLGLDDAPYRSWLRDVAAGSHEWIKETSGVSHTDRELIRVAALSVLGKQSVVGEEALLFDLYASLDESSQLQQVALMHLDETSAPDMAALLLRCGEAQDADTSRRVRCLKGLGRLHGSFNGDEIGAVLRARDLARDGGGEVHDAACEVIGVFARRGSKWVMRNGDKDETVRRCMANGDEFEALLQLLPAEKRREVEQQLKQLSPSARNRLRGLLGNKSESSGEETPGRADDL